MLSSRNEMIAVGVLIFYLAFVPGFQVVRDLLSTSVGKALALAGIIYVHKKLSCSVALLLVVVYLTCKSNAWEYLTNPTAEVDAKGTKCPDGYAYDFAMKKCQVSSSMAGGVPPPPDPSEDKNASVDTPPPNNKITTAPMTTPTATMPAANTPNEKSGVQPASGTSSSAAKV